MERSSIVDIGTWQNIMQSVNDPSSIACIDHQTGRMHHSRAIVVCCIASRFSRSFVEHLGERHIDYTISTIVRERTYRESR